MMKPPAAFAGLEGLVDPARRDAVDMRTARPWAAAAPAAQAESHDASALELAELFYAAGTLERRLILINLDYATLTPLPLPSDMRRADVWRLEAAALQHNSEVVVRE